MIITIYYRNEHCDLEMWFVNAHEVLNNAIVNEKACAHSPIKKLTSV